MSTEVVLQTGSLPPLYGLRLEIKRLMNKITLKDDGDDCDKPQ